MQVGDWVKILHRMHSTWDTIYFVKITNIAANGIYGDYTWIDADQHRVEPIADGCFL